MALGHPAIFAMGYSQAAMFLQSPEGAKVRGLVSIHGANEFAIDARVPFRLDLCFDDIAAPDPTDILASYHARMRSRADAENGLVRHPPTRQDAEEVVRFAAVAERIEGIVLCQCTGGISRSPAAAVLCLAAWTGPGNEAYCAAYIRRFNRAAHPHEDLIRLGDEALGRGGRLVRSLFPDPGGNG